jgi:hypothetical protein
MTLVLFETASGYALFKVSDKAKLKDASAIADQFSTADKASAMYECSRLVENHAVLSCRARRGLTFRAAPAVQHTVFLLICSSCFPRLARRVAQCEAQGVLEV